MNTYIGHPTCLTCGWRICPQCGPLGGCGCTEGRCAHERPSEIEQVLPVRSASVRVILVHTPGTSGVRDTFALGPYSTTEQVLKAEHQLAQAGVQEFEVVSLLSIAQWLRATQPADPPEHGAGYLDWRGSDPDELARWAGESR